MGILRSNFNCFRFRCLKNFKLIILLITHILVGLPLGKVLYQIYCPVSMSKVSENKV